MALEREKWDRDHTGPEPTLRNSSNGYTIATFHGPVRRAKAAVEYVLWAVRVSKIASRMMHWRDAKYEAKRAFSKFGRTEGERCPSKTTDCYDMAPEFPRCAVCKRKEEAYAALQEAKREYGIGVSKLRDVLAESTNRTKKKTHENDDKKGGPNAGGTVEGGVHDLRQSR